MTDFTKKTLPDTSVAIMLCTYNGARYLSKQLESFAMQTVGPLSVFVSDDGSNDETLSIIKRSQNHYPHLNFFFLQGPRRSFADNFLSIFKLDAPPARYIAYADQDDVWNADKLERAIKALQTLPEHIPGLYGTRSRLIDENDKPIGYSRLFTKPPTFKNALVQSILGGNTLVMNTATWHLMKNTPVAQIASHDWWTYLLVCAVGGQVLYDAAPKVDYRQHTQNLVGSNHTYKARLFRFRLLMQGHFGELLAIHTRALVSIKDKLTPENQHTLDLFLHIQNKNIWQRMRYFFKSGVYRQTPLEQAALLLAVLLRKI